jgi:hypothetical protein
VAALIEVETLPEAYIQRMKSQIITAPVLPDAAGMPLVPGIGAE